MTQHLHTVVADGLCRITFDRPEAFNALSEEMVEGFLEQMAQAEADDSVRVVLVTGTGPTFSAGADLRGDDPVSAFDDRTMEGANALVRSVLALSKPVVAGVNGVAAGIGASLCFAADLAVAKESASFLLAFSRLGLMPDGGASLTVAASVGRAKAMRMALLGEAVSGREAYEAGLVSHVWADDDYEAGLERVLNRLVAGAPIAFAATKRAINAAALPGIEAALERERRGQVLLFGTQDAAEGMRAFVEKRRPRFTGS